MPGLYHQHNDGTCEVADGRIRRYIHASKNISQHIETARKRQDTCRFQGKKQCLHRIYLPENRPENFYVLHKKSKLTVLFRCFYCIRLFDG